MCARLQNRRGHEVIGMGEKLRKVKVGEAIEYDCGCTYLIEKVNESGIPISIEVSYWCDEHDPTIAR